jgi:phage FluMu gp28-like protein
MTNETQKTAVDSIIEFCQKQMDNDSSIHKGVYLSIIKFCKKQITEESEIHWKTTLLMMTNNKQQTAVEWLEDRIKNQHLYPFASIDELSEQAKEMEVAGKEMSYADGYKEGYNRAIELTKWTISNLIPPHNEQQ